MGMANHASIHERNCVKGQSMKILSLENLALYGNFKQSIVRGVETREIEPTKGADYSKHTALKLSR